MARATVPAVNKALKAQGFQAEVELVKGDGYLYFTYDNGKRFDTHSVYVPRVTDLSFDRWMEEARNGMPTWLS